VTSIRMTSGAEALYREIRGFVNGSDLGLLQLLVAAARRTTFERIIACPTYPAPARTSGLAAAVGQFREATLDPGIHLPTFLARLYMSARTVEHRKRAGQFFTAAAAAEWGLSVAPPLPIDDICDAGAGTAVFAEAIQRAHGPVCSYTGVESDAILALCGAHVLESINAPSSFRMWYANFLLLQRTGFRANGVGSPTFIIANPPFVRFHNLAGRARILTSLKSSLRIELSSLSGSVSYFLLQAAKLASADPSMMPDNQNSRLLFFLPKEAAGAAHARRLRDDLKRVHGWSWHENTIATPQTGVDQRSNALALFYVFERKEAPVESHALPSKPAFCVGEFLRIRRGISTGCNEFFVLTEEEVSRRRIPMRRLRAVLPTRVPITSRNFSKGDWELLRKSGHRCWLLALPSTDLEVFETPVQEYLKEGIRRGVHATPTAQSLRRWFSIPIPTEPADVFVSYLFRGAPHFALNGARVLHLTNILGGRFLPPLAATTCPETIIDLLNEQARRWIEGDMPGREYKGGLRKIEPRELSRLAVDSSVVDLVNAASRTVALSCPSLFD
jgi:adenine-specific DNA-methyltransferase